MFWSSIAEAEGSKKSWITFFSRTYQIVLPLEITRGKDYSATKVSIFLHFCIASSSFHTFCTQVKVLCKFYELIEFRSNQSGFSCFQMAIQCLIFIHFRKLLSGQKSQTFVLKIPTKKKSQIFCIFSVLLLVIFIGRRKRISKKRRKVLNDKKV